MAAAGGVELNELANATKAAGEKGIGRVAARPHEQ